MEDKNAKQARKKKWTYMGHLGKIETWLSTVAKTLDENIKMVTDIDEITQSCAYVVSNFYDVIVRGMSLEKQTMIVVSTLNTLIRGYAMEESSIIVSQKYLQSIINVFANRLSEICNLIITDMVGSPFTKVVPDNLKKEYATNILNSLLTNFAEDDVLKKCLKLFFSNEVTSWTGSDTTTKQYSETGFRESKNALRIIMYGTAKVVTKAIIRSWDEFSKKYQSLMSDLCIFAGKFFADFNNLSVNRSHMLIVSRILSIAWNLTDNISLVPMFVKAGYAEATVQWIGKLSFTGRTKKLGEAVLSIVHNLSRHKEGLRALRANNASETLTACKELVHSANNCELDDLTRTYGMSLIALTTSDNKQIQNENLIRRVSENLYGMCKKAAKDKNLRDGGYHLSELLNSLESAFSNTSIVRHIFGDESNVETEPIKFFAQLLISFYGSLFNQEADYVEKLIGKSLLKILLRISNYDEYRLELTKHDQFCVLIEGLTKRPKQDIAKRIWCNLNLDTNPTRPSYQLKIEKQPMIYISYNWADKAFCKKFVDHLRNLTKAEIWVDFENVDWSDDMWDHFARVIENATIIIVLISSAYCESSYNFQELTYALTRSKAQAGNEEDSFIFVETEDSTLGKREWISNLSKDKTIISYSKDEDQMQGCQVIATVNVNNSENGVDTSDTGGIPDQMALKVVEHHTFLKKKHAAVTRSSGTAAQSTVCTIM